jgi:cardiolipin synthase A/B
LKLIIQPDDGVTPLFTAINNAKESLDMTIFRFDRHDLAKAIEAAVKRGVKVNALIAYANRGGEKSLRNLEMRFLEAGVTVTRSASDLIRYHSKFMVIDRKTLHVLSFNFTHMDIDRSRGFGIITEDPKWVAEALALLEADSKRMSYSCDLDTFVVSPANARKVLAKFIGRAKKQLLIYDPNASDKDMLKILHDRQKHGVEIRVIGAIDGDCPKRKLSKLLLHTRAIIRDGSRVFIGSQSLRAAELDSRREVGLIVRNPEIVNKVIAMFETDWSSAEKHVRSENEATEKAVEVLKEELYPIAGTVKKAVKKVVAEAGGEVLEDGEVKQAVKKMVKKVVREAIKEAV